MLAAGNSRAVTTSAAGNSRAVAMLAAGKGRRDNAGCREAATMLAAGRATMTPGERGRDDA